MKTITQRELCGDCDEIMRLLGDGETFVVTWTGAPMRSCPSRERDSAG